MPHTAFILCGPVNGVYLHIPGVVHQNTMEPVFDGSATYKCNEWSCKGFMAVNDNGCEWLRSLNARKGREEPMRGAT